MPKYLKAAINEKDDPRIFMNALSHIAKAKGVREISAKTKLTEKAFTGFSPKKGIPR